MVVARRKAVTTTVKVVCFLCCCCCRWWSSLQFSASGLLEALASSVVFHWSFESRGLEGAKEEQWTSFSSLKCAAALVLASASFSDPPPLALYAALFSWHQSPVWRSTRIVLPSKSAFFNQTWWVTRFTPQQKSISIILCISTVRIGRNLFRLPLSGTLTAEVIINFPIDAVFCYSELCEKKP